MYLQDFAAGVACNRLLQNRPPGHQLWLAMVSPQPLRGQRHVLGKHNSGPEPSLCTRAQDHIAPMRARNIPRDGQAEARTTTVSATGAIEFCRRDEMPLLEDCLECQGRSHRYGSLSQFR